jgi:hypothetical protein
MKLRKILLPVIMLVVISSQAWSWSNHTLVSKQLLSSMPEVNSAELVKAETLEFFLLANEDELVGFLQSQEEWMGENLWYYAPRPDALAFTATGNPDDIQMRFLRAIRVNPNAKLPIYLQLLPGDERAGVASITPDGVSIFKDKAYLHNVQLVQLKEGELVSPLDVSTSANDEPDHGMDIGLFTDSNTEYGLEYGFGTQPFGNPNLEYGTQAPFHMGFYHESSIVYTLGGFLERTYPEYRIQLYKQLAEFAFKNEHDYWGWRFMGWGLHYIGDFSNPYHITPLPGNSTMSTLWVGLQDLTGYPQAKTDSIQLVSNRHTALEDFQSLVMNQAYIENNDQHPTIQALNVPEYVREYEDDHIVTVISELAYVKAQDIHDILAQTMPSNLVNDVTVEYSQLKVKDKLLEMVKEKSGDEGFDALVGAISGLLNDFSHNGASYVRSILKTD